MRPVLVGIEVEVVSITGFKCRRIGDVWVDALDGG
jgi:hypothetical protein